MRALRSRVVAYSVVLAALAFEATLLADPGFGLLRRRRIDLQVRRPAVVRLANTSIASRGTVANPQYSPVLASLVATLETELVSNERTLVKKAPAEADWIMQMTVTGYSPPAAQQRVQQVPNGQPLTYVRWTGSLNIAYQVVAKDGQVHDADNVTYAYDREFQANQPQPAFRIPGLPGQKPTEVVPRTLDDVNQILIKEVVRQVATNLGNTVQPVEAQVASGQENLDRAADFFEKRLWARALEELEKTPVFAKPEDESYRQYNLGLAYEAISYDAKTYADQRANLFKAQEHYDKAAELNREQRYFVDVIARTRDSVARYRALDNMDKSDRSKLAQATAPPPASAASGGLPPAASASKALVVGDVLEMFSAGVPVEQILELIRDTPAAFDLANKDTLIAISRAKLPVTVQNEMRKKMGLPPLTQSATPAPATPSSPPAGGKPGTAQGK